MSYALMMVDARHNLNNVSNLREFRKKNPTVPREEPFHVYVEDLARTKKRVFA